MKKLIYPTVTIALGALAGFLYYALVGCATGTCAITASPYLSTLYGAVFGFLIGIIVRPGNRKPKTVSKEPAPESPKE